MKKSVKVAFFTLMNKAKKEQTACLHRKAKNGKIVQCEISFMKMIYYHDRLELKIKLFITSAEAKLGHVTRYEMILIYQVTSFEIILMGFSFMNS